MKLVWRLDSISRLFLLYKLIMDFSKVKAINGIVDAAIYAFAQ
jgi:hypothetical protein